MAEQLTPRRIEAETRGQVVARWAFWIVFGAVTLAALVWLRFDGV